MKTIILDTNQNRASSFLKAIEHIDKIRASEIEQIHDTYRILELCRTHKEALIVCGDLESGISVAEIASTAKEYNAMEWKEAGKVWFFSYGADRQLGTYVDGNVPAMESDTLLLNLGRCIDETEIAFSPILRLLFYRWDNKSLCHVGSLIPQIEIYGRALRR